MKNAVLIHGARQLITLRGPSGPRRGIVLGELGIIQDGALLVVDGRIEAVGQGRRVENLAAARGAVEIDATRRIVLPGFVDSHTHLVSGHPAHSEFESHDVAHTGGVHHSSVKDLRLTPSRTLERRARLLVDAFVRHGTTTLDAGTGYGLDRRGEMKTLRVLAKLAGSPLDVIATYLGAAAVPPEFEGRGHEYIDWVLAEMLPHIARRKLACFAGVRCGKGAFSLEDARRYLEAARRLGLGLKVHADQFARTGAARLAVELGAISAGHLEHVGEDDVSILAQSSTIATLVPGTAFYLDLKHRAPARALIGHGAAVALATGFNTDTSPTCSMQMVVALACSQLRMTPAEAVSAATINGAHALGCADRVGSLEAGKQADLIMLDVPDYRDIPCHFGENLVVLTMKRGVVLYKRAEVQCP